MRHTDRDIPPPFFVEEQLRMMAEGLAEAMQREVATLRREGLPIYVCDNGKVIDVNSGGHDPSRPTFE